MSTSITPASPGQITTTACPAESGAVPFLAAIAVNVVVLTVVAILLLTRHVDGGSALGVVIAGSIATVMGGQAAVARALAVADMTTVVVTSTLTAYAGETLFTPGFGWLRHRRFWAIFAIFAGALFGALMMRAHVSVPVFLAAGISAVVAMTGHFAWERAASA